MMHDLLTKTEYVLASAISFALALSKGLVLHMEPNPFLWPIDRLLKTLEALNEIPKSAVI